MASRSKQPTHSILKTGVLNAADMPRLSALYKTKKLLPPVPGCEMPRTINSSLSQPPPPSNDLNDRVSLYKGDITKLRVDAIVNAANSGLLGGGGVDGAIHMAAGRGLVEECKLLGGCSTGDAKITDAYGLPCKKVIHAVGPVYNTAKHADCERLLSSCYTRSLQLAVENDCKSVAFPAISTGVYGYPGRKAANVAITAVRSFLDSEDGSKIDLVVFVCFLPKDYEIYTEKLPLWFPPAPDAVNKQRSMLDVNDESTAAPKAVAPKAP